MPEPKRYGSENEYAAKLRRVMDRFGVPKGKWDWDSNRRGAWVEFWLGADYYKFEYDVDHPRAKAQGLQYGSDCFAQIVLTLEDLARMSERGIYSLQTWLQGLKALPAPVALPESIVRMGFTQMPTTEEVESRYREQVKLAHPDGGGSADRFVQVRADYQAALAIVQGAGK